MAREKSNRAGARKRPEPTRAPDNCQYMRTVAASHLSLGDLINGAVLGAQAIGLAVMGEGHISGFDGSPISHLIDLHIATLNEIAARAERGAP